MALFTCAEATGRRYSIGTISSVPTMASGMRPPSRASKRAPMRDSGSITRCIGRRRSEASPVMKAGEGMAGQDAGEQARRGAGIAEIEHVAGLAAAADAEAAHPPGPRRSSPSCTTSAPSARSAAAVHSTSSPSSRPVHGRLAQRQRAEHQGAVRDRLVARRTDAALQAGDRAGDQLGGRSGGQGSLPKDGRNATRRSPSLRRAEEGLYHAGIWF